MTLEPVLNHLEQNHEQALARLLDLLSIPSVSTDPAYAEGIVAAARWCHDRLESIGLRVATIPTKGHPLVLAHTPDDGTPPDVPHVIFYGHYDVQPPDPIAKWRSEPFKPVICDGSIYARGASDDKGQVCCFLEALDAWRAVHSHWPLRLTVLLEGEEECGSTHLKQFLRAHGDQLQADPARSIVLISDTTMWNPQTLSITYGLRGLLYYDVQVHGPLRDLHSGTYGGVLANPAVVLTRILGQLLDDQQRVTIPGFYDDVLPPDPRERQMWQHLNFDEVADCLEPVGMSVPFGESGFSTLERRWVRPTCDINGLYGGYGGAGAKTIIPAFAGAKVSFRLAPNQDPKRVAAAFEKWFHGQPFHGCRPQMTHLGDATPVVLPVDSPWIMATSAAAERASGRTPVLVREGATIPVVGEFSQHLGLDSVLIGFGLSSDAIHSPNEKFDVACFQTGCRTHAALLQELSQVRI